MVKDKVLVIGSGGREHALAWKLAQSDHVEKVYCVPGNGGTTRGKLASYSLKSKEDIADFAKHNDVGLIVIGPEKPLVDGIADYFSSLGLKVFGPSRRGAHLEGSKLYAKFFMERFGVPTADFKVFYKYMSAVDFLLTEQMPIPAYIKKNGLAAGKGALAAYNLREALDALGRIMLLREFGDEQNEVIIEKFLEGEEASCMALINSEKGIIAPLLPSQDHKKVEDGEKGPNTGGMGAYALTRLVTPETDRAITENVLKRTVAGMRENGIPYTGFLYPGLMIGKGNKVDVLEYNVRAGDPEMQPVLALLESDLYENMMDVIEGRQPDLRWKQGYAVCVVLASNGYPGNYEKGKPITGLDALPEDVIVFHAGTKEQDGKIYSSGGRVLGVTAVGKDIGTAIDRAYEAVDKVQFENKYFRKDIGQRELMRIK
jgi:phosphoribosylamine--glycine ligase